MENSNHFTCLAYDNLDFLIQSKYIIFGIYLDYFIKEKNVNFENEILPHIYIGDFISENFNCKPVDNCYVMLVLKKDDLDSKLQKMIEKYTETQFPSSGNFALSVNSAVSSTIMDTSYLRLIPQGIRPKLNGCGISAIVFAEHRQILLSPDNLLRTLIKDGR